ncbi:hypothetical protein GCM10027275_37260 [Rhabdobacter roseus]|nr:peptidylprolyl isomerase [Rhabdobacter roseus]
MSRLLWALVATTLVLSCKTSSPPQQATPVETVTLLQLGDRHFSPDEFFQSYTKNRFSADSAKALSAREYFDLYTNLKLKVLAAQQEGRDTASDFKEEIASYRETLAKNYLVDKNLVEELTSEAYERLKEEVHVSHMLIAVSEFAAPADTLSAYRAAVAMRARLLEGVDFAEMAEKFSKDPTAPQNRGDLGYFTAFQMLYPFENAAYQTPVGQISEPVRTRSGYHLIKVHDRRPSRGKIQVAHLMVRLTPNATPDEIATAQKRAEEAHQRLTKGEAWEKIVGIYSDDFQSRKSNGVLPLFGTGEMVPPFEEAAFSLATVGEFSRPVRSPYGWHIIRLLQKRSMEPYATMAPALRQKVVTDSRGKVVEDATYRRLRAQYAILENPDTWAQLAKLADSSLVKGTWVAPTTPGTSVGQVLFSIEKQNYAAQSFLEYVQNRQKPRPAGSAPEVVLRSFYQDYLRARLQDYEKNNLETKYPDFRTLMNEIREGVLLSQVMEKYVWQRSLADSVGQQRLYDQNREKYRYPERALATIVSTPDTATLRQVRQSLAQSPYPLRRKGEELLFAKGQSTFTPELREKLFGLLATLVRNQEYVVEVSAYRTPDEADSVSANRLRNTVKYLTDNQIPIVRIIEKDHGSFRPVPEPDRNRRVGFQFYSRSKQDVAKAFNAELSQSSADEPVSLEEGYFSQGYDLLRGARWEVGEQTLANAGNARWIEIRRIEPARVKTFAEARGSVINDYQKVLEQQWLNSLRAQFPVKVNEPELEKLVR